MARTSAVRILIVGGGDGRLFLMRPDGYMAFKAGAGQVGLLGSWVAGLLGC